MTDPTAGSTSHSEMSCHVPSSLEWSYFAGLFDGEGCIRIVWHNMKRRKTRWQMNLAISNTHRDVLLWVQGTFGGGVYSEERKVPNQRRRFQWYSNHSSMQYRLLEGMLPYLIIKKEQAEIALAFLQTTKNSHVSGKVVKLDNEEVARRDEAARKLRELRWKEYPPLPKKEIQNKACLFCLSAFSTKSNTHRYCSTKCWSAFRAKSIRDKLKSSGLTSKGTIPKGPNAISIGLKRAYVEGRRRPNTKTHCVHGHPFDATNTYWYLGCRHCKTCRHLHSAKWSLKSK